MPADDPYRTLGLERDASQEQIRRAYRKLAKQHHPDLNPGKKDAEARFKAINAANDLLSDEVKRARFDRGEIDASGAERPEHASYRHHAEGAQGAKYQAEAGVADDLGDIFADLFGRARRPGAGEAGGFRLRGADRAYALTIDFLEAAKGGKKRLALEPGGGIDVTVPPGIAEGQVLRLHGKGEPGIGGGPPGDALIEIHVAPHPFFRRDGDDIRLEVPMTLGEAVLGGKITVPTIAGPVTMTVPKGSDTGTVLRLRGRGIAAPGRAAGDQYVTLKIVLGGKPDAALEEFVRKWSADRPHDPRRGMVDA